MRKHLIVLALLIALFAFVSCDGETASSTGLVGAWKATQGTEYYTVTLIITLEKNGSGTATKYYEQVGGVPEIRSESFSWSDSNNVLSIKDSTDDVVPDGSYPYTISTDRKVIRFQDGTFLGGSDFIKQ